MAVEVIGAKERVLVDEKTLTKLVLRCQEVMDRLKEMTKHRDEWRDHAIDRRDNHAYGTYEQRVPEPNLERLKWEEPIAADTDLPPGD